MPLEAAVIFPALKALTDLGINAWTSYKETGIGEPEQKALKALFDTGLGMANVLKGDGASAPTAAHFALVTRAFGEAFRRYWCSDAHFAPGAGLLASLRGNKTSRARAEQIEERLLIAAARLTEPGGLPAREDLKLVNALVGDPKNTPYYRKLWGAYTDPTLLKQGQEPLILEDQFRTFERLFDLAYAEGLSSPQGKAIRDFLLSLGEDRAQLVKDILLRDIASWGSRHVFGVAAEQPGIPMMPLSEIYVEPRCIQASKEGQQGEATPVLKGLEWQFKNHPVAVLRADFGHGKSLTARTLAQRIAEQHLLSKDPSPQSWRPIFVKCAEDFESHGDDLNKILRRAQRRLALSLGLALAVDDPAFDAPPRDHKTLIFIDGLDEVALSDQEVKSLFRQMHEQASEHRRFLVFSRPAVLPPMGDLKGVPVLELLPLQNVGVHGSPTNQIEDWLLRWNRLNAGKPPITREAIEERGLSNIAGTPILLFMICHSWEAQTAKNPSLGDVYEAFFQQIARGKHSLDCDKNKTVAEASEQLRNRLRQEKHLPRAAPVEEAMLWLMGRVAWKAKCLEDAQWIRGEQEPLDLHHVRTILRDELRLTNDATLERTIQMGLLLALQANLQEGTSRILFGHKSFREFLIARYWAGRLERNAKEDSNWDFETSDPLLQGRLMTQGDESFDFLQTQIKKLPEATKKHIARKAARCFNSEALSPGARSYRDDLRPLLREAALAIASSISTAEADNSWTLRSLLSWFWLRGQNINLSAPALRSPRAELADSLLAEASLQKADLARARLTRADLSGADLTEAYLTGANLSGAYLLVANLTEAHLTGANLTGANLTEADLSGAYLTEADLTGADLTEADLTEADLTRADLTEAKLIGADLTEANLTEAYLSEAKLTGADLTEADLTEADLTEADLSGAKLTEANLTEADLTKTNLSGAHLSRANLFGACLTGARLTGASLFGARLTGADLSGADLSGAHLRGALWRSPRGTLAGALIDAKNPLEAHLDPQVAEEVKRLLASRDTGKP